MSLETEIHKARTDIVSDGYDMSIGELLNLYRDEEIIINPDFQRLFRWDLGQKSRFIESLLLGIPIPPIFVYQNEGGIWELIDGLQRLSTVLEFVGILRQSDGTTAPQSVLGATRFLPSLSGKMWSSDDELENPSIGHAQRLQIKRARARVEILKQESDTTAKYELFQRLNTGGAALSAQEVRNCIAVMINPDVSDWLKRLAQNSDFLNTIAQTDYALERQIASEFVLRFIAFRHFEYMSHLDVHPYLDGTLIQIAQNEPIDFEREEEVFNKTFALLNEALGSKAFKQWDGNDFTGKFLFSIYEVVATGVSNNLQRICELNDPHNFVKGKIKQLGSNETFRRNSGSGVRGSARLVHLLPMANTFFNPDESPDGQ